MYSNPDDFKEIVYNVYRKNVWDHMHTYCIMMCEKDQTISELQPIANQFRMKLFSCAGQNSDSSNWEISQLFKEHGGGVIFYFGDWDSAGYSIPHKIKWFMKKVGEQQGFEVKFVRVLLKKKHVIKYGLTTIASKSKFKKWIKKHGNKACEIDVMEPEVLIRIAKKKINKSKYFDMDTFNKVIAQEERDLIKIKSALDKVDF